jgi:hypothetical protein
MTFNEIIANLESFDLSQLVTLNQESARVWDKKNAKSLKDFTKGDKVSFEDDAGKVFHGTVIRRGRKSVKVELDSTGYHWRVSPSRIRRAA